MANGVFKVLDWIWFQKPICRQYDDNAHLPSEIVQLILLCTGPTILSKTIFYFLALNEITVKSEKLYYHIRMLSKRGMFPD